MVAFCFHAQMFTFLLGLTKMQKLWNPIPTWLNKCAATEDFCTHMLERDPFQKQYMCDQGCFMTPRVNNDA